MPRNAFNPIILPFGQGQSGSDARDADENARGTNSGEQDENNGRKNHARSQKEAAQAFEPGEFIPRVAGIQNGQGGQDRTQGENDQLRPIDLQPLNQRAGSYRHQKKTGNASQCGVAEDTLQRRLDRGMMSGQVHDHVATGQCWLQTLLQAEPLIRPYAWCEILSRGF